MSFSVLLVVFVVFFVLLSLFYGLDESHGATGGTSVRVYEQFDRADSVLMIHWVGSAADSVYWTDTTQIDTTIPEAALDTGLHVFATYALYGGTWIGGPILSYLNDYGGAASTIPFLEKFEQADSVRIVVNEGSQVDTVMKGQSTQVDTTLSNVRDSLYVINTFALYGGDWIGGAVLAVDNRIDEGGTVIYDTVPSPPSDTNKCAVAGRITGLDLAGRRYVVVTFTLNASVIQNTCDSVLLVETPIRVKTDGTGWFTANLLKNSCMRPAKGGSVGAADSVFWKITWDAGGITRENTFYLPEDSSTYVLNF